MSAPDLGIELRRALRERTILERCAKALSRSAFECRGVGRSDLSKRIGKAQRALCAAVEKLDVELLAMRRLLVTKVSEGDR